ncbi:MAG: AAA family ATPase [Pirellulales bacterium]|nr:AAA family ATPase [Pirellulales bacterium]
MSETPLLTTSDAKPHDALPAWYPAWARELADLYFSGTTCVFVLHGNVHDLIYCQNDKGEPSYCSLNEFLAAQVFGKWDLVLGYDLSRGLRAMAAGSPDRLRGMMQYLTGRWGEPAGWPREPDKILLALDLFIERNLLDDEKNRKSLALIFDYAQYLISAGDLESLARGNAARLVKFLSWAQSPLIKRVNMAFVLIVDKLVEISDRLVNSPHVGTIDIPLPDRTERERFVAQATAGQDLAKLTDFTAPQLVELSNGLSLTSLDVVLAQAAKSGRRLDAPRYKQLKKQLLERQCQGLIEFVEPRHTLELVIGHDDAINRLRDDAAAIQNGHLSLAPMGYLVCGPVGTGKTWLAECFAGSIGIPCVVLKNFRSKYVGETEGNLEQVLSVLRSLGPVLVIIDEADAALGNRQASGDSGTSSRVFSMIASQMGNTAYRGKIVWMLLTSRPDLLPIDLKRQGRAEVHIPLLYPHTEDSVRKMFQAMAKKNKITLTEGNIPPIDMGRRLSGADIESVVLTAKRAALTAGRNELTAADLEAALAEFIPSAQGLEKELQEIAAVLECTQMSFLPPEWQERVKQPNGRSQLQERMVAIRQLLEEGM